MGSYKDSVNDFNDHKRYSYSRKYKDLDRPKVGDSAYDVQEVYSPRDYKDYERPRIDSHRSTRDFHKDSLHGNYDLNRSNSWDLRSKLKRNRENNRKPYERKYRQTYKERNENEILSRVDYLKKESKTFFKRKHRSPLCEDEDDEEEEEDKSSVD